MAHAFLYGNSGAKLYALIVKTNAAATVTAVRGTKSVSAEADSNGIATFYLPKGNWTITGNYKGVEKSVTVELTKDTTVQIILNLIPAFTYTGNYIIVNDSDVAIDYSPDNWKIRFLTSGILNFTALNGAENGIDVFLVGGGAGGCRQAGAGGYTITKKSIPVAVGTLYQIVVAAGGKAGVGNGYTGGAGGVSSGFGYSANGAPATVNTINGSSGGSGSGASGFTSANGGNGGSDGGNGSNAGDYSGGTGQGTTTREFGDSGGRLYAGGGGGGTLSNKPGGAGGAGGGGDGGSQSVAGKNGETNTGGGGGGAGNNIASGAGGSGIVIIRNARG